MRMLGPINTGAATGGAGVATATVTTPTEIGGRIYGVYVRYNDSPPAGTTDVTIASHATNFPAITFLTLTNAATDGLFLPRMAVVTSAGAAFADSSIAEPMPIDGRLTVTIAGANDNDSVDVWVFLD